MKNIPTTLIATVLITLLFLTGIATAATVTDTTVTNTNIYSGNTYYDIAPTDYYDETATSTTITHVSARYLYATGLKATPQTIAYNQKTTISGQNQQGAAVVTNATCGTDLGYTINYGIDGEPTPGNPLEVTYTIVGTKTITGTMTSYAGTTLTGLSGTVNVLGTPTQYTAIASKTTLDVGTVESVTLSLEHPPEIPAGDNYVYTWKLGNTEIIRESATYTHTWQFSTETAGTAYILTCEVKSTVTGMTTASTPITVTVNPIGEVTVTNTNVYAATNKNPIAPGTVPSTATAENVTHIANSYAYAEIEVEPQLTSINHPVNVTVTTRYGASIITDTIGAKIPTPYQYDTGITTIYPYHSYITHGEKTITYILQNPAQTYTATYPITVLQHGNATITSLRFTSPMPAVMNGNITAEVTAQSPLNLPLSYQWYVQIEDGTDAWRAIEQQTTTNMTYVPEMLGMYKFKVKVTDKYETIDSEQAGYKLETFVVDAALLPGLLDGFRQVTNLFADLFKRASIVFVSTPFIVFIGIFVIDIILSVVCRIFFGRRREEEEEKQ